MKTLLGAFFRSIGLLIAHLPLRAREALAVVLAALWFDVFRIRRRVALENLEIAYPEKSLKERTHIARESIRNLGQTMIEFAFFPTFKKSDVPLYFDIEGEEFVKAVLAEGKGAILLSLHIGSGDFAVAAVSQLGYPTYLISKEFKSKWLNDLWFGMRALHGTRFIAPEKSSFEILRALKRNGLVFFILDQWMGPPSGVRTQFFGKETGTALGLAIIAGRTKVPVIPCYTWHKSGGRHGIVFEKPIPFIEAGDDSSPKAKNIAVMTQIYTDKIEEIIRRHPEQWMWIHRRWKEFRD